MPTPTDEMRRDAIDDFKSPYFHPVSTRILRQAYANGICCPRRASIHPFEYQRLKWHVEAREARWGRPWLMRSGAFGGTVLQIWAGSAVCINLYPSEEVPYGAIRWEPSE
jgi:hypothetical protein